MTNTFIQEGIYDRGPVIFIVHINFTVHIGRIYPSLPKEVLSSSWFRERPMIFRVPYSHVRMILDGTGEASTFYQDRQTMVLVGLILTCNGRGGTQIEICK